MKVLKTDSFQMSYCDEGEGPVVVLLHSTGASHKQWRPLIKAESSRFRFLAPDLLGYGETCDLLDRPNANDIETEMIRVLVDQAEGPVDVVGHSYGGMVAMNLAQVLGKRLNSLTLIEPVMFHLLKAAGDAAALAEISELARTHIAFVESDQLDEAARVFMSYWIGEALWKVIPDPLRGNIVRSMAKVADDWRLMAERDDDDGSQFAGLAKPVQFLVGEQTTLAARTVSQYLAGIIPTANIETIDGAGHMAPVTNPDQVNPLIVDFLLSNSVLSQRAPDAVSA